jgi:hypothetical protein
MAGYVDCVTTVVRLVLLVSLLFCATPALACPNRALCARIDAPRAEVPNKKRPRKALHKPKPTPRDPWKLTEPKQEKKTPSVWSRLERDVYDQMPQYRSDDVVVMLAPVVVRGTDDTVPGLGISGRF